MNTDFVLFAVSCVTHHPGGESFSAPFASFWFGASPCLLSATVAMCLPFQDVYVYCKVGGRSASAARTMEDMGFKKIYDLKGGILQWEKEGFKQVK